MKEHSLYGEVILNEEIETETDCRRCSHTKVCSGNMSERCVNYHYSFSEGLGCQGCINRFTRDDEEKIPCFKCKDFLKKERKLVN